MSKHGSHRPSNSDNKKIKPPKDATKEDMEAMARTQGKVAKIEGKTPPNPKD